ncbi:MAG: hypothetical protein ACK4X2_00625 [Bacteroidota bacterium]|jgi:hypothetical protein
MGHSSNLVAKHLTGKENLSATSVDVLESLHKQYPFFAPAAVLAAAKSHNNGTETSKAALAVGNTGWLQQILTAPMPNAISNVISKQLADYNKPVTPDQIWEMESPVLYHTIDYFASQGIKIDLNKGHQDELSTKLKKFTDWLKEVKHPVSEGQTAPQSEADTPFSSESDIEKAVVTIAEKSNESREVVTETMAEVLGKQGRREKAIQLYQKLSFINPEKSVYFAAKIQQLKGL